MSVTPVIWCPKPQIPRLVFRIGVKTFLPSWQFQFSSVVVVAKLLGYRTQPLESRKKDLKVKLLFRAEFYTIPPRVLGVMSVFQIKITREIYVR